MANKEYIERMEAILAVTRDGCTANVVGVLFHMPAADVVEVRHGEWKTTGAYPHFLYCSECNRKFIPNMEWIGIYDIPTNYCPCCGAKMDGERKEQT